MSWIIMEHLTGERRGQLMARRDVRLDAAQLESLRHIVDEVLAGKPLQYVLGETEFYGLRLKVSPEVLIPRPETEELVNWVLSDERKRQITFSDAGRGEPDVPTTILDIGTGSGCIAIALARHLPAFPGKGGATDGRREVAGPACEVSIGAYNVAVWACDVSNDALQLARENAALNDAAVRFEQVDILDAAAGERFPEFDVIVSNPPYVTRSEMDAMAPHVLEHEPHLALFVENNDPLLFYRKIAAFARQRLCPGGRLYVEINEALGRETCDLFNENGLCQVELRKDIHGKDRMIKAVKSSDGPF